MADHSDLVAEMPLIERMTNQERMKLARKRRNQQMKKWSQREKELTSKRKKTEQNMNRKPSGNRKDYKVHFVPSVMLLEAAARNDVEEVRRLLMLGVSPDSTNEDGLTALHQCCIDDSEEMMKLLIEFGANVNAKDSEQWTPLHAAATCGLIHLVEYLISKGADLLAVNADGNMPYDICEDEGTLDFIEGQMAKKGITQDMIDDTRAATERRMLLDLKSMAENDEDLEPRDHQGATPLHIASANGYITVVEFLLDQNISLDVTDKDMWQPIHAAACWGHPDVIEVLVQAGADLSAKTKNGETPYDICEDPELKDRIIQLKCEMETKRATQPQKLKRSQSQNTRSTLGPCTVYKVLSLVRLFRGKVHSPCVLTGLNSQSVRRTSIREKTQISRREALEEARIRQEKQETTAKPEEDEESKLQKDTQEKETISVTDPDDIELALTPLTGRDTLQKFKGRLALDALDTNIEKESKEDVPTEWEKTAGMMPSRNEISGGEMAKTSEKLALVTTEPITSYESSTPKSMSGESVTVEILVTFNASPTFTPNPGTLADLKKQRNDMRNSSISSNSSSGGGRLTVSSSQPDLTNGSKVVAARNGHCITATYTYEPPPSPTVSLQRFRSAPSEVVGGETEKHGCCSVM